MNGYEPGSGMRTGVPQASEAMAAGELAGKVAAFNELLRFAAELQARQGPLDDPRPLEQIRTYCADKIRAVTGG